MSTRTRSAAPSSAWPLGIPFIGRQQREMSLQQLAAGYETVREEWLARRVGASEGELFSP